MTGTITTAYLSFLQTVMNADEHIGGAVNRGWVLAGFGATCMIWSSTWVMIKIGLDGAPPFKAAGLRFLIAACLIFATLRVRGVRLPRTRAFIGLSVFLGAFQMGIPYGLVYWGEQHISSGLTAVLFSTIPLFTAVTARALLGDPLSIRKITGIALGIGGVYIIFLDSVSLGGTHSIYGVVACLGSSFLAAFSSVIVKKYGRAYDPFASIALPMTIGALILGAAAMIFESDRPVSWDRTTITSIVYLAVFGSVSAFGLYFWLIKQMDVTVLSYQTFIIPIVALLIGWIFLRETVTLKIVTGGGMILAGIALAIIPQAHRKRYARVGG